MTIDKDTPPWLQPVPDDDAEGHASAFNKWRLLVIGGSVSVVALFVSGIFLLAGNNYDESAPPKHIAAPDTPYKEKPEQPGGMEVDHQDKEILNSVSNGTTGPSSANLGTQPEQPIAQLDRAIAATEKNQDTPAEPNTVEPETQPSTPSVAQPTETKAPANSPPIERSVPAKPTPAEPAQAAVVQQTQAPAGQFRVQLGAFSSRESAERAHRTLRQNHRDLIGDLAPEFQPVQSGERTLYRLRLGTLVDRASADQLCLALRAKEQGCIVVAP